MSGKLWIAVWLIVMPSVAPAQSSADSASYRRAQTLVNDGNATMGRALVDSMVAKATPGTNAYAEALYWRAVLSATAADAEMDYRRIVVDYPLSPRVEDVLLRLAQLELARADYDAALQHLNRLTLEHPAGASRARAGYWMARVLFEKNDIPRACAVNADALARTNPDDTELRNQISYLNQRCAGVALAPLAPPTPSVQTAAVDSATAVKADTSAKAVVTAPTVTPPPAPAPIAAQTGKPDRKPEVKVPASPRDGKPTMVNPAGGIPPTKASPTKPAAEPVGDAEGYSVQIAAYNVKSQAEAMVAKLKKRGYEARVSGSSAPFRVRIGHYATQSQAAAVMRSLKAKKIDAFVVKAELR
jgi:cell division septation protein DedD